MRLLFFIFFYYFIFNRLIIKTWCETNELNKDASNNSYAIFYLNEKFAPINNDFNLASKLMVSNPSNSLLKEKIKISMQKRFNKFEPKSFEPSLVNFENLVKAKNFYNYKSKAIVFKPSANNLEHELFNNSQNNVKNVDDLSINSLKSLIKVDFQNKYEKKRLKVFLPGYQGFHGEIYHNLQAYQHFNQSREKRDVKSADINDYNKWLDDESRTSRLERFKKLYEEFSKLRTHVHDHDFRIKNYSYNQIEKPLKKLKKTIEHIELEEQRKQLKQEL